MSSQDRSGEDRGREDSVTVASASKSSLDHPSVSLSSKAEAEMKRAAVKQRIENYYNQLTDGCGNNDCDNIYCASSSRFTYESMDRNKAAAQALDLLKNNAPLCETSRVKVPRNDETSRPTDKSSSSGQQPSTSSSTSTKQPLKVQPKIEQKKKPPYLNEAKVIDIIAECKAENNWLKLIRTVGSVFNNPDSLVISFCSPVITDDNSNSETPMETQSDGKDSHDEPSVDIESVRRTFKELFEIPDLPFNTALMNALNYLSKNVEIDLKFHHAYEKNPNYLNIFLIVFEIPDLSTPEYLESAFPLICQAAGALPIAAQGRLARIWSKYPLERLTDMIGSLQQLITVRTLTEQLGAHLSVNDVPSITSATKVLKIIYFASLIGGVTDSPEAIEAERIQAESEAGALQEILAAAVAHEPKEPKETWDDPLAKHLGINATDCRKPLIPFEDFINEPLNEHIEMDRDYAYYRSESDKFSFMPYSFILNTATKNLGMYFDNRIRMVNERRSSLFQSIVQGAPTMPYLRLRVRRDHIIDDALVGLEMAATDNPQDLKKQLFVEFEGEQGIDEGGVQKEFFQLIVEEIFNPDFGMFTYDEETFKFLFNPTSFENDGQFTLIGIILGLAIYNNVILDIHFPMVVYRKLMGKKGTFEDFKDSHPVLAQGLQEMLDYEGSVEETFMQAFQISYLDVFGTTLTHDLKPNGENIIVNNENREEFVNLYADFLLNKSIERQFRAFKRGFTMVTDESPLKMLFRPEEIELLICGSKDFDFGDLESAAEYDGGFTVDSTTIKNFWEIVHGFDEDQKRKLLQFTTGSDRVPVGGLSRLKLIIARNGPDSERLPTSHTCFNVLLLPEYSSKEKLEERLLKAINYAKGFGML